MPAVIIAELCAGCGQCASACPRRAIKVSVKRAVVDPDKCDDCEECVFSCINGAIVLRN